MSSSEGNTELREVKEKELKSKAITYKKLFAISMELESMMNTLHKEMTVISNGLKCGEY